jgi:hypothetical protein
MLSESHWAALIYGRTYETDFRFLVLPEDFTSEDKDWVLNYIHATTRSVEKLPEKPRWSLFRNEHHCVFGVTCMARELISLLTNEISEEMTRDSKKRPLYIFLGYVAKVEKGEILPPLPNYSDKNLAIFQPLYKYVIQKWEEKSYQVSENMSQYQEKFDTIDIASENSNSLRILPEELNFQDEKYLYLWCNSDNQNLWFAASQSQHPVSICLGLASPKHILKSPFFNGTAFDVQEKTKILKVTGVNSLQNTPSQPQNPISSPQSASEEKSSSQMPPGKGWGKIAQPAQRFITSIGPGFIAFKAIVNLPTKENQPMDSNFNLDLNNDGIPDGTLEHVDLDNDGQEDDIRMELDINNDGIIDSVYATKVDNDGDGEENGYRVEIDYGADGTIDDKDILINIDSTGDEVRDAWQWESGEK